MTLLPVKEERHNNEDSPKKREACKQRKRDSRHESNHKMISATVFSHRLLTFFLLTACREKSATVFLSSFSCNSSTSFWSSVPDAFSCFFFLLSLIFPPLSLLEACEGKESPFGFLCSPAQRHCCCSHFKIFLPANRVSWRSHLLSFSRRYSHVDMILLMP